jgi:RNA-directed DNA polymerase
MELLEKKIDDTKFLNVIRKMLKAGYVEEWKFHDAYSGTPQGGIISPILANIYLHELDCFVETLIVETDRGQTRKVNTEYDRLQNRIKKLTTRCSSFLVLTFWQGESGSCVDRSSSR